MSQETTIGSDTKVQKRNGQFVPFNVARIQHAIANSFKEVNEIPREAELTGAVVDHVEKVTRGVLDVLKERAATREHLTVEEIQDEVIRQLYESGYKDAGEAYAVYRKQHAARRSLFDLYTLIKRDGRVVSFKPEKITMAIAKALQAHHGGNLTESLLEKAREVSRNVIEEIRKQWPDGKAVHIEEIQDLVEKSLMAAGLHEEARRYI